MMIDDGGGLDEPLNLGNIRGIDEIRVYDRSIAIPDYTSIYKLDPSSNLSSRTGSSRFRHRFLEPEFYDVASIYGSFRVHESRCLVSATARSLSGPPSHSTGIGGSPSISGSGRNCGRR